MSMRNEMIRRWKERRSASGTSTLTDASAAITRPTTAVDSEAEAEFRNHALPKIIEAAVVAAFSSDNFREAVASMVDPAFTRQHDKLNQLKLANLNLESLLQTRLDELPSLLQPAIDHMTSIKVPSHEKELEKLAAGQDGCLHLLEAFSEKMDGIEQQLQGFDGRMKALEEKVVNADLRSAIRFGEISNELQDRNTTLNDRLWELEREVGGKVDGQQRRIVGLGEDFGKGIRKIQEKISALETLQSTQKDEGSISNNDLFERIEKMGKSLLKLDAMESSLRRDIHALSFKVSSLDTSSLESHHRRLEGIERALSGIRDEIATQGTLASLDSKLLSVNNARLDTVASNVTKLGFLLESVKEQVFDDEAAQSHAEKLESLHLKMVDLIGDIGSVQKHVGSLDTSVLTSHSEKLQALESKMAELIGSVGTVQQHIRSLDTSALTSHSTQLGDLVSSLTRVEEKLKLIDTAPLASHSERLGDLVSGLALVQMALKEVDTTPLSSHSETLFEIEARIAEMRESIDGKFSTQAESFDIINEKISSLPEVAKVDAILASLEDTKLATSNGIETLSNTADKILDNSTSTQATLSSHSATLQSTSQELTAFRTEIPDTLKPLVSKLENIWSHIDFGEDTLVSTIANLSEAIEDIISMVSSLGSETSTALAKISSAAETSGSNQAAATKLLSENVGGTLGDILSRIQGIHGNQGEIQKSIHEMHGITMSEIRHKDASILAEVQKANASHAEHSARFEEVKASADAHTKALGDGFANLGTVGRESHARLDSISTTLDVAKISNAAHATALDALLTTHKQHSTSLDELLATSTQLLNGQEKSIPFAETQFSALAALHESVPKKEDLETLRTHNSAVLEILGKHSSALEGVSTSESISSLSKQISEARDLITSSTDDVQSELKSLKPLLGAQESLTNEVMAENNNVRESVAEVLEEIRSNKALMEEHSSSARTEGTAIMEGILGLRVLSEETRLSSELAEVKALVQDVKDGAKAAEAALQAQLKSVIDNGENTSSSLASTSHSIESLKESLSPAPVLERIANLKALVEDIDINLASVTPEILVGTKSIEHAMMSYARTIMEMNSHIQTVKDDPTTSLILSEIGTIKETEMKNMDALLTMNDSLGGVGGKIKDSETAISKSLQEVQAAVSQAGLSKKAEGDALAADLSRLETSLATSTNELQEAMKVIDTVVQANGQAIGISHSKLSDVHTLTSRIAADMTGLHTEHFPKLSHDIQAINLSKLNTAVATTEKELTSITTTLDELTQLSRGRDALIYSIDAKVTQTNDTTTTGMTKLQSSIQSIDTTLTQSTQTSTKTQNLLQSHTPLLETINSSLASSAASTTNTLSALSTTLDSISTELSTVTPAVRINSAAISRVDRAVLETGAQIKSVVLDGSAKTSREIDAALEQIDESLHDSNTRLMGISDFELPRIEQGVKELEGLVERELDGGVRETRRNGSMLGVIGARVVGTQKLFDEMVDSHERRAREEGHGGGGRSLEWSGVLSPGGLHLGAGGSLGHGRGEFRRLGSSRFRSHSNASSGKETSGSVVKGNHS
jgi:predicted  nucleic acid-binding Zn-ribbon protein